jgi:formate dehydrogenase subunit gamma
MATWKIALLCALLALEWAGPSGARTSAERAAEEVHQQAVQPGNNAPLWREVRSGAAHSTNAQGVEAGVLIQSRGESWRKLRPPLAFAGGALLAACLGALAAFYLWRGPIGVSAPPTGRLIERFDLVDRATHWTMGISFVVLAATGLILSFGKYVLLPVIGYTLFAWLAVTAKSLHNFVGPLFMLSLPFFIVRFAGDNLPRLYDLDWLAKFGGMFSGRHVPSGRFNAGEKTLFWGLVCVFSVVLCASGLVLDFPNFGQGRGTMQSANVIHFGTALLAVAASLFHIYLGTLGVKGAYRAMREGVVDETWAREHHELWYEEVKAGRARQRFT